MRQLLESLIKQIYKRFSGYDIGLTKLKISRGPFPQAIIRTRSTYSPWLRDTDFKKLYNTISHYTKVDILRCYELWQLVPQVQHLEGDILEVGVWRGGSGALIAHREKEFNNKTTVYLCDTFTGVVKASDNDNYYINGEHQDTSETIVKNLTSKTLNLDNVRILKGMFPDDTGSVVQGPIKLCHIDVDVYEGAKQITEYVWEKLVIGGIIVYDDYGFSGTQGVTKFVNSQRGLNDRHVIHNINGHGVIVKLN